jgi:hypothetical protein
MQKYLVAISYTQQLAKNDVPRFNARYDLEHDNLDIRTHPAIVASISTNRMVVASVGKQRREKRH